MVSRETVILAIALVLGGRVAWAGNAAGSGALALAALVAEASPITVAADKRVLISVFDGKPARVDRKIQGAGRCGHLSGQQCRYRVSCLHLGLRQGNGAGRRAEGA
jgi:hypothetical protein